MPSHVRRAKHRFKKYFGKSECYTRYDQIYVSFVKEAKSKKSLHAAAVYRCCRSLFSYVFAVAFSVPFQVTSILFIASFYMNFSEVTAKLQELSALSSAEIFEQLIVLQYAWVLTAVFASIFLSHRLQFTSPYEEYAEKKMRVYCEKAINEASMPSDSTREDAELLEKTAVLATAEGK